MKLYMAVSIEHARQIIDDGFVGIPTRITNEDGTEGIYDFVMMRDRPPTGLFLGETDEVATDVAEDGTARWAAGDGTSVIDNPGDLTMVVDIPHEAVEESAISEDPPAGWPFREYWLPADALNQFRATVIVIDPDGGEEVQSDLVGR